MRLSSDRPLKNGGYLHPLNAQPVRLAQPEPPRPTIDAERLMRGWWSKTASALYDALAASLGVSVAALRSIRAAWAPEHSAWAFPMRNGAQQIVGIRLRGLDGHKWSVRGGHEGVFLPRLNPEPTVWICEGPTDCAALLTLGKFAIGRPSCSGGIAHLAAVVARLRIRRAVIIADNDDDKTMPNGKCWNPGLDGAQRLAEEIGVPCCVVVAPCKDAREFLLQGGTSVLLDSLVQSQVWQQPKRQPHPSLTQQPGTSVQYRAETCQA